MSTRRICVFCGSNVGTNPAFAAAAERLGRVIVERGYGLVFGGGHVGLMGRIADAVLAAGGEAIGVIPAGLERREVAHRHLTQLHVVQTMHERKALMAELSDGFVALPGGIGTLEELFEAVTWAQLGIHAKPCGILDVNGYYRGLLDFLDAMVREGFVREGNRSLFVVADDAVDLLDRLEAWQPPDRQPWLTRDDI